MGLRSKRVGSEDQMVIRRTPDGENKKSLIHVALIGAAQAVAVALITAVTQYVVVVTPLKNDISVLKKDNNNPATKMAFVKEDWPPGNQLVFIQTPFWSHELWKLDDFKENLAWDKKCRTWATTALANRKFLPVTVGSAAASRGERDGIHLGIHCFSSKRMAILYGLALNSQVEKFHHLSDDLESELVEVSDGDLYQ
jgi:hypothetical protein